MFEDYININSNEIINDFIEILSINTTNDVKRPNMPYGEGVYKGLKYILDKGNGWQMKTQNYLGHCGHMDAGTGEYTIGILCNIDIPTVKEGWIKDSIGVQENGDIYGVGSRSVKGPLIACIYAMKFLKESNRIPKDKKIRLILGCDKYKERKSVNYYKDYEEAPEVGFSPDGVFPAIYGEKGIIDLTLTMNNFSNYEAPINIVDISGGKKGDGVPDKVSIILSCDEIFKIQVEEELKVFAKENNIKYKINCQNKLIWIEIQGKYAKSNEPEKGINAISYGMKFLHLFHEQLDKGTFVKEYERLISTTYRGEKINCSFKGDESGEFTFNVEEIRVNGEEVLIEINITHPIAYLYSQVLEQIRNGFKYTKLKILNIDHARPITFNKDSFVVKKLTKAYREITGDKLSEPYAIAGKSYARVMSNTIAFGPFLPQEGYGEVNSLEFISKEQLFQLIEIYTNGLIELMK